MSLPLIYLSYDPNHSLHIAQPLFNALRTDGYDVFMDIHDGVDTINLNQVAARDHFLMILVPGTLQTAKQSGDRLTEEFRVAHDTQRNIILLMTKDFDLHHELQGVEGIMTTLRNFPAIRLHTKMINDTLQLLASRYLNTFVNNHLQIPPDEAELAQAKIDEAWSYTRQSTIRLNTERRFFQAVVKIRQGHFDEALAELDFVIADNPQNESAYLQRGRVLRKLGRKLAAMKDYEQAAHLSPKLVAAHIGLGELLLETGRHRRAHETFTTAYQLQPDSAPAIAGIALTYHVLDQTANALDFWGQLLKRDDNYADAHWVGEVFDWEEGLVTLATDLLAKR